MRRRAGTSCNDESCSGSSLATRQVSSDFAGRVRTDFLPAAGRGESESCGPAGSTTGLIRMSVSAGGGLAKRATADRAEVGEGVPSGRSTADATVQHDRTMAGNMLFMAITIFVPVKIWGPTTSDLPTERRFRAPPSPVGTSPTTGKV